MLAGLTLEERAAVLSYASSRRFAPGDVLFQEGEPVRSVSLVSSGQVKIVQHGPCGEQVILQLCGPGDVFGGLGASPGKFHNSSAQAAKASEVLTWETSVFEQLAQRFPLLRRNAVRLLAARVQALEESLRDFAVRSRRKPA